MSVCINENRRSLSTKPVSTSANSDINIITNSELNVIIIQRFSLKPPQQPKNDINEMTAPSTIINMAAIPIELPSKRNHQMSLAKTSLAKMVLQYSTHTCKIKILSKLNI